MFFQKKSIKTVYLLSDKELEDFKKSLLLSMNEALNKKSELITAASSFSETERKEVLIRLINLFEVKLKDAIIYNRDSFHIHTNDVITHSETKCEKKFHRNNNLFLNIFPDFLRYLKSLGVSCVSAPDWGFWGDMIIEFPTSKIVKQLQRNK